MEKKTQDTRYSIEKKRKDRQVNRQTYRQMAGWGVTV